MALNFNQGAMTALRGRQFADLKPDAEKALSMVGASIQQQKDRLQERLDKHKEMRKQIGEMTQAEVWGRDYKMLQEQAKLLQDPKTLDKYMSSEEGMLEYEQLVNGLNDQYAIAQDKYARTHGSADDDPTSATYEAWMMRNMSPEHNYYEKDGFEDSLDEMKALENYDRLQNADYQDGSMKLVDGKFVYVDKQGNEVDGYQVEMENPFDPQLQVMDVSGGTFFRKMDDGKFEDEEQVAQFVRDNFEENEKYQEQALRHYAEQTQIDGGVSAVMENLDHYGDKAKQMWIDEATAMFREKKKVDDKPKPSEGDKRAARERAAKKERQQHFYDAITRTQRTVPRRETTGTTVLPTGMTVPTETVTQEEVVTMNVPLQGIQGTMSVSLDGEKGQMRPQMFEINDQGQYVITGVASFEDADPNRQIETRSIVVDPNDFDAMTRIMGQLDALTTRELDGISIRKIIESPEDFGIRTTQVAFDPNNI
jgi:hypothetical protein